MEPRTMDALIAELSALRAALADRDAQVTRVRALHEPLGDEAAYCTTCDEAEGWPCATRRALDGAGDEPRPDPVAEPVGCPCTYYPSAKPCPIHGRPCGCPPSAGVIRNSINDSVVCNGCGLVYTPAEPIGDEPDEVECFGGRHARGAACAECDPRPWAAYVADDPDPAEPTGDEPPTEPRGGRHARCPVDPCPRCAAAARPERPL